MPQSRYSIAVFVELKCSVSIKLEEVLSAFNSIPSYQKVNGKCCVCNMGASNSYVSHCKKFQKYEQGKIGLKFFDILC